MRAASRSGPFYEAHASRGMRASWIGPISILGTITIKSYPLVSRRCSNCRKASSCTLESLSLADMCLLFQLKLVVTRNVFLCTCVCDIASLVHQPRHRERALSHSSRFNTQHPHELQASEAAHISLQARGFCTAHEFLHPGAYRHTRISTPRRIQAYRRPRML